MVKEKVRAICELRETCKLGTLLKVSGVSRSTFYYNTKHGEDKKKKDAKLLNLIKKIHKSHYKKYGSPRIWRELRNMGININIKRVERVMRENHINATPKRKRYCSYKGEVGVTKRNVIKRYFNVGEPERIFGTDVTQFNIKSGKLYQSPIIDFHTREIMAYDISEHPNMNQIKRMMERFEKKLNGKRGNMILHSDQGWQYQQKWFQDKLEELRITQSMSRKGNCLDNAPTENFFGRLKEEMFYDYIWSFETLEQLRVAIDRWIKYYNNVRIVNRLNYSPIQYKEKRYHAER